MRLTISNVRSKTDMCLGTTHRHSIFCIVPDYVLRRIAQNGTPTQRSAALQTLAIDKTFTVMRAMHIMPASRGLSLAAPGTKQRTIYTADHTQNLPGTVVRNEGGPASGDEAVDEAYDDLGDTFDFYWEVFQRNSIDAQGLPLDGIVHYGTQYDNAFWNGQQMVFGDGDGVLFNRFTIALDVIGHELTHGVTEDESQLAYILQPGALNESMSDVFGVMVKQYKLKQTADKADWLIGAGLLASGVHGVALRSMKAPGTAFDDPLLGKDPQPDHMKHFVHTLEDNGGVHINSGIPNHAFYILATNLGGYAWEKAGRIWYETLTSGSVKANTNFANFAKLTAARAGSIYGSGSTERKAVIDAWNKVGIKAA
jgi:Zn-dependent metalloprotease